LGVKIGKMHWNEKVSQSLNEISNAAIFSSISDQQAPGIGSPEALALRGKTTIANAMYRRLREIFQSDQFISLRQKVGFQYSQGFDVSIAQQICQCLSAAK
jgi:hypothetical protein